MEHRISSLHFKCEADCVRGEVAKRIPNVRFIGDFMNIGSRLWYNK